MSQIKTDVGRSRAWLRLSLNEGMITSYLIMIREDKSSLSQFYKRYAFLRDLEAVNVAINLLQGLGRFSFAIPTNSSVLNIWPNSPLLLAGLWTPPMKETPVSLGTDIVKGLSDDYDKVESLSISSLPISSGRYGEEEAFKKIFGTPVEGSPVHSRFNMEEFEENCINDAEVLSCSPVLSQVKSFDDNNLVEQNQELESEKEVISEPEEKEENITMESYHKVLDSYKIDERTVQKPNIEEIINKFSPGSTKQLQTSESLIKVIKV